MTTATVSAPDAATSAGSARRNARYQHGGLARYLRPLVREWMDVTGCSQEQVAHLLEVPPSVLSDYLNRRSLPADDRLALLSRIGGDVELAREHAIADRLQAWMDAQGVSSRQAGQLLDVLDHTEPAEG